MATRAPAAAAAMSGFGAGVFSLQRGDSSSSGGGGKRWKKSTCLWNLQRNYSVLKRKMPIQRQPELQRKQGARFRRPSLLNR
ncbi:putative UAP56-interacting factor-like protein, partial [Naja naja]